MTEAGGRRLSPFATGLAARCPRCGQGRLFAGYLQVSPACERCGLDLRAADSGDGPAFFVMWIVSAIVVLLAALTEIFFEPALWVHVALWIPLVVLLAVLLLRPIKGLLIALQYRHRIDFADEAGPEGAQDGDGQGGRVP